MLELAFFRAPSGRSPVEEYIENLDEETQAIIDEALLSFCEEFPDIESVSIKHLQGKLWEIRIRDRRSRQHRILYFVTTDTLVLLHAFTKKTRRTPKRHLEIALKRLRKVLQEEG